MFFNASGSYTFEEMIEKIEEFIIQEKAQNREVKFIIGTDSQRVDKNKFTFAIAVAVHSVGHGGTFFIRRIRKNKFYHLSERLFEEANMSLDVAQKLRGNDFLDMVDGIEVHADVGVNGKSARYANAIKAMIESYGFEGHIKPRAAIAAHIADRYTK